MRHADGLVGNVESYKPGFIMEDVALTTKAASPFTVGFKVFVDELACTVED